MTDRKTSQVGLEYRSKKVDMFVQAIMVPGNNLDYARYHINEHRLSGIRLIIWSKAS